VLLLADVHDLRRFADAVLHVVRWNRTRRVTVAAALQRLRDFQVRPDGVVLCGVNQKKHRRYSFVDACLFYRRYGRYYGKCVETNPAVVRGETRAPAPEIFLHRESVAQ
jgi:polysaccharide biosynthesis transport protein